MTNNKIEITLDQDAVAALEGAVAAGQAPSVEGAAVAVIEAWAADLEETRRLIQEGIDSGPSVDGEAVFARLRAKYGALAEERS
jgi:antitoxin ParD1/3/4